MGAEMPRPAPLSSTSRGLSVRPGSPFLPPVHSEGSRERSKLSTQSLEAPGAPQLISLIWEGVRGVPCTGTPGLVYS